MHWDRSGHTRHSAPSNWKACKRWTRPVRSVRFPAGTMVRVTCPAGQAQLPAASSDSAQNAAATDTTTHTPEPPAAHGCGSAEPFVGNPLVDLVRPRRKQVLLGRLHLSRPRPADPSQPAQLLLVGNRTVPGDALRFCRRRSLLLRRQGYLRNVLRERQAPAAIRRRPAPDRQALTSP